MALIKRSLLIACFLFCSTIAHAQINANVIIEKYDQFQRIKPVTKIQLVFNQEKFIAGETAYFKAYFFYDNMQLVQGKQLIDFSLIDSKGSEIIQFKMNIVDGIGYNQLQLPDKLNEGFYLAVAESDWMKNFTKDYSFKKEIEIVSKNSLETAAPISIAIFPEGGHLISDELNKVVVATNRPQIALTLVDGNKKVLENLKTDINGFAFIQIKPALNQTYTIAAEGLNAELPAAKSNALGLNLSPNGKLVLFAQPNSPLLNEPIFLAITSKGKVHQTEFVKFNSATKSEIQIDKSKLPFGVNHIAILNSNGKLLANRSFYISQKPAIDLVIEANKAAFATREKVNLTFALSSEGRGTEGEFSITVLNAPLFDPIQIELSEAMELLYNSAYQLKIDKSNSDWVTSIDNFLIAKNESAPWAEIFAAQLNRPNYYLSSLIQKSGKAIDATSNSAVPNGTQIIFYLQNDVTFYQAITATDGLFDLNILDVYGEDELFYTAETPDGNAIENLKIEWRSAEKLNPPKAREAKATNQIDAYAEFSNKVKVIGRSYSIFTSKITEQKTIDNFGITTFEKAYFEAEDLIKFEEYKIFPDMTALIKEVINPLRTMTYARQKQVKIKSLNKAYATGQPLYIIDGIATKNTAFFLSLKTSDLIAMKIFRNSKKLARLGFIGKNGIVMVQTKAGNTRETLDPDNLIQGLQQPLSFTENQPEIAANTPNFRSTIFWSPSIKTDFNGKAQIEFTTTDDTNPIFIRIDGMTTEGVPFTSFKTINVGSSN
jgi:hypothetical protein